MLNGLINLTIQRWLLLLLTRGMEIPYLFTREDNPFNIDNLDKVGHQSMNWIAVKSIIQVSDNYGWWKQKKVIRTKRSLTRW